MGTLRRSLSQCSLWHSLLSQPRMSERSGDSRPQLGCLWQPPVHRPPALAEVPELCKSGLDTAYPFLVMHLDGHVTSFDVV